MKRIPLTQGKEALVDDEDFEYLNQWKWQAQKIGNVWYVKRCIKITKNKTQTIFMHRLILDLKHGDKHYVDHVNGNGLDNRKNNLRICNNQQNQWNQHKTWGASKYKGVSWNSRKKKWRAALQYNKTIIFIGYFKDEIKAAKAYNLTAIRYFGKFAGINNVA